MSESGTTTATFSLGDNAAKRIAMLLQSEPAGSRLRISVSGGGCSGFQYLFDFENAPLEETDLMIDRDGARVAIDASSLGFLQGSQLDYVESLGASSFEIKNPNSTASCGCGNSFSVM